MRKLPENTDVDEFFSPIDRQFAAQMCKLAASACGDTKLAAAVASHAVGAGNVCLSLTHFLGSPPAISSSDSAWLAEVVQQPAASGSLPEFLWPELKLWRAKLLASGLVGENDPAFPLVLDQADRLYLSRYYQYERKLSAALRERAQRRREINPDALHHVRRVFGAGWLDVDGPDRQLVATIAALRSHLTVITGGPGTGKTTTVARIIACIQAERKFLGQPAARVMLLTPTGKAAARLGEAVQQWKPRLAEVFDEDVVATIPQAGKTLHRALGFEPRTPTRFAHHADNPLLADVVVVDEASMVDVAMMSKLVDAVEPDALLIFLGDRHQLASVEAGAILGDICSADGTGRRFSPGFSEDFRKILGEELPATMISAAAPALADCIVELTRTHRFTGEIARFTQAVQAGQTSAALALLQPAGTPGEVVRRFPIEDAREARDFICGHAVAGYRSFLSARTPEDALARSLEFRVLCANRRGLLGVEALNHAIEVELAAAGLIRIERVWYHGRLIMVTQNDNELKLFNGDVGVVWREGDNPPQVCFSSDQGQIRSVPPSRLPACETVFAMTIHKSQGSEFQSVAIVLPADNSALCTRELCTQPLAELGGR